jgi:iron-sulfur cluster repair protein YtfE (RIC family)
MNDLNITEYFGEDHDRLDDLFKSFQQAKRTDFPKAKGYFSAFKQGLQRHIVWEEEILFPMFERKSGLREIGPTAVMRAEHREIKAHLEAIHDRVNRADPESDAEEEQLVSILTRHNDKEEHILYPGIDRLTSREEKDEIFRQMQATPEQRYKHCCEAREVL